MSAMTTSLAATEPAVTANSISDAAPTIALVTSPVLATEVVSLSATVPMSSSVPSTKLGEPSSVSFIFLMLASSNNWALKCPLHLVLVQPACEKASRESHL